MISITGNQLLRDPFMTPTDEAIANGLGNANKAFIIFIDGLEARGISLMNWRYYNDGKAWLSKGEYKWKTPRGADKVKPIFWLSIWEGFFKTSFFFDCGVSEELLSLPISPEVKELIRNSKPMGKTMRFMPVILAITSDKQLDDVYELAQYRKKTIKKG